MIKKSYLLLGLVLISFVKLSPTKYLPEAQSDPSPDIITQPVPGLPLCITPQTQSWLPGAKFLAVSAKKTFSIVGKDKATKWVASRLTQPPKDSTPSKGYVAKGGSSKSSMMCGASTSYTTRLLSIDHSEHLACKKTGELYLTSKQNEESVWNAVAHPSTGYPTTYTSKKYGFLLDASKIVTQKKKVGKKTVSLLMLKK